MFIVNKVIAELIKNFCFENQSRIIELPSVKDTQRGICYTVDLRNTCGSKFPANCEQGVFNEIKIWRLQDTQCYEGILGNYDTRGNLKSAGWCRVKMIVLSTFHSIWSGEQFKKSFTPTLRRSSRKVIQERNFTMERQNKEYIGQHNV